jgi:two-component system, sensor histidine kinase and response regulator
MRTVLIVDDEDVLVEMLSLLVEDLGFRPLTASNGQDALSLLFNLRELPMLVLSDVMMPKMSGVDLTRHLKVDPKLQHIPVILLSAAGCPKDSHLADYFINKPFDMDDLAKLIEHIDRQSSNRRSTGSMRSA